MSGEAVKFPLPCRLCGLKGKLIRSHILPEFFFKPVYDVRHRFTPVGADPRVRHRTEQKGIRERLLCEPCDGRFGEYERYAAGILFGGEQIAIQHHGQGWMVTEIDYPKFKLFEMSILWRASIAGHLLFARVVLGEHEDRLRSMLYAEDPGSPEQYGCVISAALVGRTPMADYIAQVSQMTVGATNAYRFVFGGFLWLFFVTDGNLDEPWRRAVLQRDGSMRLITSPAASEEYFAAIGRRFKDTIGK